MGEGRVKKRKGDKWLEQDLHIFKELRVPDCRGPLSGGGLAGEWGICRNHICQITWNFSSSGCSLFYFVLGARQMLKKKTRLEPCPGAVVESRGLA
jgi:hypothetical protein